MNSYKILVNAEEENGNNELQDRNNLEVKKELFSVESASAQPQVIYIYFNDISMHVANLGRSG